MLKTVCCGREQCNAGGQGKKILLQKNNFHRSEKMKLTKTIFLISLTLLLVFSLVVCSDPNGANTPHEHSFGDWQSEIDEHWRVCGSDEAEERSSHVDADADELCDECGYDLSVSDDQDDSGDDQINDDDDQDDSGDDQINDDDDQDGSGDDQISDDDDQDDSSDDQINDDDQISEHIIPTLLINEIRTEYTSASSKVEFIEFKIIEGGNLDTINVFTAGSDIEKPTYVFPSAEVKAGEYVVLYLRKLNPASVDETGDNLALSPGVETSSTAREFWMPGTDKQTRKTDIIFIKDRDDTIVDAVMMSEKMDEAWSKRLTEAADLLGSNGAWLANGEPSNSPSPLYAIPSQYTTTSRTISRDETMIDSDSESDWFVTASSGATPGAANSDKRYEPE
jgi:hypothetical protein